MAARTSWRSLVTERQTEKLLMNEHCYCYDQLSNQFSPTEQFTQAKYNNNI